MVVNRRLIAGFLAASVVVLASACTAATEPSPSPAARRTHVVAAATTRPAATLRASKSPAATPTVARMSSSATGGPVARGGQLCEMLGAGDFSEAGVMGAGTPKVSSDEAGGYYCVYSGKSGATGGIEFEAFTGDPVGTYQTIEGETGTLTELSASDLQGADQAGVNLNAAGAMAVIVVRSGQLTFDIYVPSATQAKSELIGLAALVLQRGSALE